VIPPDAGAVPGEVDRVGDAGAAHVWDTAGVGGVGSAARPLAAVGGKPGRTKRDAPRQWRGKSVERVVAVEYGDGRVEQEPLRFVVVHSSQLAQQQAAAYATAQTKEAEGVAEHIRRVQARSFACVADAEAAIAQEGGRASLAHALYGAQTSGRPGRRGRLRGGPLRPGGGPRGRGAAAPAGGWGPRARAVCLSAGYWAGQLSAAGHGVVACGAP
jgi:hypothetical protein